MMNLTREDRPTVNIFVYGTLMNGQPAHHYLENARFLGEFILDQYAIYDLGYYPGIKPDEDHTVIGEVYEIDADMLPVMDRYEGEGSLYDRVEVSVRNESGTVSAYVYVYRGEINGEPMEGRWGTI